MTKTLTLAAAFLACILAANYVTTEYGMVPVGFGLVATAGTYFAGLTFVLRDSLQDTVRASRTREEWRVETIIEPAYSADARAMAPQLEGLMRSRQVRRAVDVEPPAWVVAAPIVALIVIGAALSLLLALTLFRANEAFLPPGVTPVSIAVASGVAFLVSELADLAVYTPLRRKGYVRAALASNAVGIVVDTLLFLWVSGFGIAAAWQGQLVGKAWLTIAVVGVVAAARTRRAVTA